MTQQEFIDQNLRMMMGDLMVQIIMLKARIAELEAGTVPDSKADVVEPKVNGGKVKARKHMADPTANPYLDPVTGLPKTGTNAPWLGTQNQIDDSVAANVTKLPAQDSALNQMARTEGLKAANRRGLLNSSMAVESSRRSAEKRAADRQSGCRTGLRQESGGQGVRIRDDRTGSPECVRQRRAAGWTGLPDRGTTGRAGIHHCRAVGRTGLRNQ